MEILLIDIISIAVFIALVLLAVETIREFRRMDRDPRDYSGSDRLAGTAE